MALYVCRRSFKLIGHSGSVFAMEGIYDLAVDRFYKRVSVRYFVRLTNTMGLISFYPSVQLLENGPKLQFAIQVASHANSPEIAYYHQLISTVDGFDLAVSNVDFRNSKLGGRRMECKRKLLRTKTFSLRTKCNGNLPAGERCELEFGARIVARHGNYSYKMIDRLINEQFWPANGTPSPFADVDLVVSGVSFKAHRAILAARSAVFAAMLASAMSESTTGIVEITDVSPEIFAKFLQFIYTGRLDTPCFANRELATCADKYDVGTLSDLCNESLASQQDAETLRDALVSSEQGAAKKCENNVFLLLNHDNSLDSAYFRMHDNFKGRIYFRIMLKESNQDYTFWLIDQLHGQQLWSAAVNGQFADIQFLVGERTFYAHQVIVAARSSHFAKVFKPDKKIDLRKFKIGNCTPCNFEQLLYFKPSSIDCFFSFPRSLNKETFPSNRIEKVAVK